MISNIILKKILFKNILMILIMVQNFFRKMQSGKMKLEDSKELYNTFKSNLNEISKGILK